MAELITYLDFDLLLERSGRGYRARVIDSPAGSPAHEFAAPFSDLELENFVLKMGQAQSGMRRLDSPRMEAARTLGTRLLNAVMGGEVGTCFARSLDAAAQANAGLRIRLRLADVPELVAWPWEYLYSASLGRFLALSIEMPVVRFHDLAEVIRPLSVKPPLRILALIASPANLPRLDVEAEWARLRQSLADLERRGLVKVERADTATLAELQTRLRRADYHIVHFIGHGAFDADAQTGVIMLENEARQAHPVSGEDLGILLHDERTLRLIVLNACEGARTSAADPFGGVAQSLVRQGVPAVIAMQFAVSDIAAITFTREFYAALADGYPVDAALTEVRKAIFALPDDVEWGTPVLYLRAPDGRIFDVTPARGLPPEGPTGSGPSGATHGAGAEGGEGQGTPPPTGKRAGCNVTLSVAISFVAMVVVVAGMSMAGHGPFPLNRATPTPERNIPMNATPSPGASMTSTVSPSLTPSATPTPRPTATRTPQPTTTPSPSVTAMPSPTITPRPTLRLLPGTAARCVSVDPALASALRQAEALRIDIGCPTGPAVSTQGAIQEFYANPTAANRMSNLMIWRKDTQEIYTFLRNDTGDPARAVVRSFNDTWVEGQPPIPPACAGLQPPTGHQLPVRGFGAVWCSERLMDTFGWPSESEQPVDLLIQPTESGLLLGTTFDSRTYAAGLNLRQGTAALVSP